MLTNIPSAENHVEHNFYDHASQCQIHPAKYIITVNPKPLQPMNQGLSL